MSLDDLLDLHREDVEAARDDHVLDAVDNRDEAARIDDADVAGVMPAVGGYRGRFLGLLVVAQHHHRRTHDDLSALARGQQLSIRAHDGHAHHVHGLAGRTYRVLVEAAVVQQVVHRALDQDRHQRLRLSEALVHDRPEDAHRLLELLRRDRRGADDEALQRREVGLLRTRMREQRVDGGGRQEDVRDPLLLDQPENDVRVEGRDDDVGAALDAERQRQQARRVRQRCDHEVARAGRHVEGRTHRQRHHLERAMGVHRALGRARGAARGLQEGHLVRVLGRVLKRLPRSIQPVFQRRTMRGRGVDAHEQLRLRQLRLEHRDAGLEDAVEEHDAGIEVVQDLRVGLDRVADVH